MLSSLPLQILFFFNGWYVPLYTVLMIALFIWKGTWLPYSDELRQLFGLEVALVFVLAILDGARLFLGSKGNKTERVGPLFWSLALVLPSVTAYIYYTRLQIYVTRGDVILNAVAVVFVALEVILSVLTIATFTKARAASSTR